MTDHGDVIHIKVQNSDAFVTQFIKQLDVPIRTLNIRKPTLNDVFLAFTGENIHKTEEKEA